MTYSVLQRWGCLLYAPTPQNMEDNEAYLDNDGETPYKKIYTLVWSTVGEKISRAQRIGDVSCLLRWTSMARKADEFNSCAQKKKNKKEFLKSFVNKQVVCIYLMHYKEATHCCIFLVLCYHFACTRRVLILSYHFASIMKQFLMFWWECAPY